MTWPALTIWPSVKAMRVRVPAMRDVTLVVARGVTVPSACSWIGMSPRTALAVPTVVVGRPPRLAPPLPAH